MQLHATLLWYSIGVQLIGLHAFTLLAEIYKQLRSSTPLASIYDQSACTIR